MTTLPTMNIQKPNWKPTKMKDYVACALAIADNRPLNGKDILAVVKGLGFNGNAKAYQIVQSAIRLDAPELKAVFETAGVGPNRTVRLRDDFFRKYGKLLIERAVASMSNKPLPKKPSEQIALKFPVDQAKPEVIEPKKTRVNSEPIGKRIDKSGHVYTRPSDDELVQKLVTVLDVPPTIAMWAKNNYRLRDDILAKKVRVHSVAERLIKVAQEEKDKGNNVPFNWLKDFEKWTPSKGHSLNEIGRRNRFQLLLDMVVPRAQLKIVTGKAKFTAPKRNVKLTLAVPEGHKIAPTVAETAVVVAARVPQTPEIATVIPTVEKQTTRMAAPPALDVTKPSNIWMLSDREAFRSVSRAAPPVISSFVYCAIRDEPHAILVNKDKIDAICRKFVSFIEATDREQFITYWLPQVKLFPAKVSNNKYEELYNTLITFARGHYKIPSNSATASAAFVQAINSIQELSKFKDGVSVTLAVVSDKTVIPVMTGTVQDSKFVQTKAKK